MRVVGHVASFVLVGVACLLSGCVTNQVGSARNGGIYASKAARSAESAESAVATVQLVAGAVSDGKAFGSYASIAVDQQEDTLTEITTLFRSIQPPDDVSRGLREELGGVLDTARADIAAVRIEIRRGRLSTAKSVAVPLGRDAAQLDAFAEAHR
jgi:hypothetical protein